MRIDQAEQVGSLGKDGKVCGGRQKDGCTLP